MLVEGGAYDGHTSTFTVRDNLLTLPIDIHTVLSSLGPSLLHRHPLLCEEGTRPSSVSPGSALTAAAPRGLNRRSSRVHRVQAEFFRCNTSHTSGYTTEGWSVSTGGSVGQHRSGLRAQSRACGKRPWAPVQLLSQGTFRGQHWSRAIQCAHPLSL